MDNQTRKRIMNQKMRILELLRERGPDGATNHELSKEALHFTSVLSLLHREGHIIDCVQIGNSGTNKFILRKLTAEAKYYPSAWEDAKYHFHTTFNSTINGDEEFEQLFEIIGGTINRKYGYYKDQMKHEYDKFQDQMQLDL
jgi:arabinogalactan endo-1,4-beta-galactosidase